ncbi:hypothetical protein RJ639_027541 [Escallonia herrerae]|uniref:DUF7788 domain-containing protein n=1 Tax=Escallonia herrerae TaxID=1293975 RepID=A0AA88X2X3_9ASTE|nr:hypothetical protein RJ639_027541 [Escallonia herrerae]
MDWGMNTDFQKVFDRILEIAAERELSEDQMIKRVFVFIDREFDVASQNPWETDYEAIQRKFGEKGYRKAMSTIKMKTTQALPINSLVAYQRTWTISESVMSWHN